MVKFPDGAKLFCAPDFVMTIPSSL